MIATAIPAGFAAGLFGIGGGLVTVPILFYIFSFSGIETAYVMHLAVGTSFGIIIPTSTVSVLTHHQHKAVDFSIVKGFGFFVATGVILGTIFAASLETKPLILFFTISCICSRLLLAVFKGERNKYRNKNRIILKSHFRNCERLYFCTNGYWWSCDECANFKIFRLSNK